MKKIAEYFNLSLKYWLIVIPIVCSLVSAYHVGGFLQIGMPKYVAYTIAVVYELASVAIIVLEVTSFEMKKRYLYVPLVMLIIFALLGNTFDAYNYTNTMSIKQNNEAIISQLQDSTEIEKLKTDIEFRNMIVANGKENWFYFINIPCTWPSYYVTGNRALFGMPMEYAVFLYAFLLGIFPPTLTVFFTFSIRDWLLSRKKKESEKKKPGRPRKTEPKEQLRIPFEH